MSRDMHMYLEHFDKQEGKWAAVQLFAQSHDKYVKNHDVREVAFMEGGWSEAMSVLTDAPYNGYPELAGIDVIYSTNVSKENLDKVMFKDLSDGIRKHYERLFDEEGKLKVGYFGLGTVNCADIATYIAKYPEVVDYESEDEDAKVANPFTYIIDRINMFADLCDIYFNSYSEFRLVYWGDC